MLNGNIRSWRLSWYVEIFMFKSKIPLWTKCFLRPQKKQPLLFYLFIFLNPLSTWRGEFAWMASVHSGARLNPVSTACYYNRALSMHKGPLLLELLMGPLGGECSAEFVSLATLPSYSFIFADTHTQFLSISPLKSRPSWPSLMPLIRLSITLEEIDDYLILITYKGESLFDVYCASALWLPIAFTL